MNISIYLQESSYPNDFSKNQIDSSLIQLI